MKKILLSILAIGILVLAMVVTINKFNNNRNSDLDRIRLAEVAHSVLYAPMYVAIENGFFEDFGIEIELILTPGADRVGAAVLSNDVQVGFAGVESIIYIYQGGEEDYLVGFAGLIKRDGQFIVSRERIENFTLDDLRGKEVLAGRAGGMPALNFEYALRNQGLTNRDVNINTNIDFAALAGSFIGGNGDFVNLFEPLATKMEREGFGYVVASVGELAGEVPYTIFYARKSFIDNNLDLLIRFTKAIELGLQFMIENDDKTIAEVILPQFPDTSLNDLTTIIGRYRAADAWNSNPFINEESFNNMLSIMREANLIRGNIPYDRIIRNLHEK